MDIQKLTELYRNELTQNVLPFWQKKAFDPLYGGVFEAVDEEGNCISTDKPVIAQAQAVWAFAFAYNQLGGAGEWLELAVDTAAFLLEKGRDAKGNWYQQLDRRGFPLTTAEDFGPALYSVMALGQLFKATGEQGYVEIAQKVLTQTLRKRNSALNKQIQDDTKGRYFKQLEEFALIGHVLLEAEGYMDRKWHKKAMADFVAELTNDFYDKRTDILLDHVTPSGHFQDCPAGRLLVPGRVLEVAGLTMEIADRARNRKLLNQMLDLVELTIGAAWDEANGGFYYKMDVKSLPPLDMRWNHKLAWVHLEALQAIMKAHLLSARPVFLETFEKVHEFVWEHFPDLTHGEWFGELNREGQPLLRHKITPEKGCCYLVRNLTTLSQLLEIAADLQPKTKKPKTPPTQSTSK